MKNKIGLYKNLTALCSLALLIGMTIPVTINDVLAAGIAKKMPTPTAKRVIPKKKMDCGFEMIHDVISYYVDGQLRTTDLCVYLPPNYNSSQDYPVVYFLHGQGGGGWQMNYALNALPDTLGDSGHGKLDRLINTNIIEPMIMVAPEAENDDPNGFHEQNRQMFTAELPYFMNKYYGVINERYGRSIDGFSMGASGGGYYLANHTDLYASLNMMGLGRFQSAWIDNTSDLEARQPWVRVAAGSKDPWSKETIAFYNAVENEVNLDRFDLYALNAVDHYADQYYGYDDGKNDILPYRNIYGVDSLKFHQIARRVAYCAEVIDPLCSVSVALNSFEASNSGQNQITVNWETGSETDYSGALVLRSTEEVQIENRNINNPDIEVVSDFIPGTGNPGTDYYFVDSKVQPNTTYYYYLQLHNKGIPAYVYPNSYNIEVPCANANSDISGCPIPPEPIQP